MTVLPWGTAVLLHLGPGTALLLFFLGTGPLLRDAGLPPIWGLLLGTLVVIVPIELGIVWKSARRQGETRFPSALRLAPVRRADGRAVAVTAVACLVGPGLLVGFEAVLRDSVFAWLPGWFTAGTAGLADYSPTVRAVTVALWVVGLVLVGPAVEEIYFRGWLLPRLSGPPALRVTIHAGLFAVYHLWQPYAAITIFVFALPLAVLAETRRNPTLSLLVHCSVNLVVFGGLLAGVMQR